MSVASDKTIGIVCALKEEARSLLDLLEILEEGKLNSYCTFQAKYNRRQIHLVVSGMGKKNAAQATQALIDSYKPAYVINFGTAGGLASDIRVGDVIVSSCAIDYSVKPAVSYQGDWFLLQQASSIPGVIRGVIASADKNVETPCQRQFLWQKYQALCCDWESATVLQMAQQNHVPAIALRVISDVGGKQSLLEEFRTNLPKVLAKGTKILLELIRKI